VKRNVLELWLEEAPKQEVWDGPRWVTLLLASRCAREAFWTALTSLWKERCRSYG
jgi:hypothetical protein